MRPLLTAILLCVSALAAHAQDVKYVSFKQGSVKYRPKQFHLADVADDRASKNVDGLLHGDGGKTSTIYFQGGLAPALRSFISKNVSQDKATQAFVLHITKLDADIKKKNGIWEIKAGIMMTLFAADKKVIEFTSNGVGKTDADPAGYLERFVRQSLEADLKKMDAWWPKNKGKYAVDPDVKVVVTLAKTSDKPNHIVYSGKRPLQIVDFTGPPEGKELELAATLSGIAVGYEAETKNSQFTVSITVTPYFDKNLSWFKEKGKNARVLAHEQAHFDITAIKACEMAAQLRKAKFTQTNFEQLVSSIQQQNGKASNDEEIKYDAETQHGTIESKQLEWQERLKEQVKTCGCY